MSKKRIWFNNWFNTAYHIINLIKQNGEVDFEVFGTNRNPYSTVLKACDHSGIEEHMGENEYIDFCLDYCKKNDIEIFVPRSNMSIISKNSDKFESLGVKLLICCDWHNHNLLNNKAKFYEHVSSNPMFNIPKYKVVNTAQDFEAACKYVIDEGFQPCFKPVFSEGGAGFRIIDENAKSIQSLFNFSSSRLTLDDAVSRLSQKETFNDLMVMEYIGGHEVSIDCLGLDGKLICAVPRKKLDGRIRVLEQSDEMIKIAQEITSIFNLSYAYNIQVRFDGDKPKLLEVNPRMSGGVWISCYSGINFPYLAVKLLMDNKIPEGIPEPKLGIMISQIEEAVVLKAGGS